MLQLVAMINCNKFKEENLNGDWIMHIIPVEEDIHPVNNYPSILFIKNTLSLKTYYFVFKHPDYRPSISIETFLKDYLVNDKVKWVVDKKSFTQMLNIEDVRDINLINHWEYNDTIDITSYETVAHTLIHKSYSGGKKINLVIPLVKHKELFELMANDLIKLISNFKVDTGYIKFNNCIINPLKNLEMQGIYVDAEQFKKRFNTEVGSNGLVYSQYNIYTSTGRPSNRFGGINYAALNHTDGSRKCFQSRYGNDGRMVLIDYTAFHPRIICYLTKYNIPIDIDIYTYLAKLYFRKSDVDDLDIKMAKQLTFKQFFGGVDDKYSHIKYLANLKYYINTQWEFFNSNGYVLTPIFNRKITNKHIEDPNPPKLFNYILQATEGEISIPRINLILNYLNNKKTKAILYTYDAILYDFHRDDGKITLNELYNIMSINGRFPMKVYIGNNYHEMNPI